MTSVCNRAREMFQLLDLTGEGELTSADLAIPDQLVARLLGRSGPVVVCTVRLAIGFLLVLSKWCAQSRLAIGF